MITLLIATIAYHFYADDSQLFLEINLMQNNNKQENIEKLCSQMHLSLNKNDGKTEVVFFGRQLHHDYLKPVKMFNKEKVPKCFTKLLGFYLDYNMSFEKQINHCCKLCYLKLRKLYSIRRFLTLDQRKMFVTSFILSKLDYCNALYMKVNKILLIKLQKVQNTAARFVLGATRRTASTNELLKKLHWLPVYRRIRFKICCFMFRVFHNWNCADYLYNLFKKNSASVNPSRRQKFILPKCRTEFTKKSIAYQGAVIWNSLPVLLTDIIDWTLFKRTLKTVLFCEALWAFYHSCVQERVVKPIIIIIIVNRIKRDSFRI